MIKTLVLIFLGMWGGLWIVWPGISTGKGWGCTKDFVLNGDRYQKTSSSLLRSVERKIKISSSVSPEILLKQKDLNLIQKIRILGDACFRL